MLREDRPRVLIAGGGSGGHVFPGLALADALRRGSSVEVVFAGTHRGMEARIVPEHGYRLELLDILPIKGGGAARAARGALVAAGAVLRSVRVVRRLAPRAVVSVGGYAAGPVALAAFLLGVPIAVVEPNGVIGLANRILGPLSKRAYVAWGEGLTGFGAKRTRAFGVPLRRGFTPVPKPLTATRRVLVLGGSQGAAPLNERVPEALSQLLRRRPGSLEVLHQAGRGNDDTVRQAYARLGVTGAEVSSFLDDVPTELARADAVVARSGAGTVAEVTAIGRPALLIPLPHAADDHQTKNAVALERVGGAVCLPQRQADAGRVAIELEAILFDEARHAAMSRASRAFGRPYAASEIAADLCALLGVAYRTEARSKINGTAPSREAD